MFEVDRQLSRNESSTGQLETPAGLLEWSVSEYFQGPLLACMERPVKKPLINIFSIIKFILQLKFRCS
jgi:hypothetical protein